MDKEKTIGEKLSPILVEIEDTIWEFEANAGTKPDFTLEGFRAACKIFMCVLMDKMFERQLCHGATQESAMEEAELTGYEMRALVLKATGIDTHKFYKTENNDQ